MVMSDLTFVDLERSNPGHLTFEQLYDQRDRHIVANYRSRIVSEFPMQMLDVTFAFNAMEIETCHKPRVD